MTRKIVALFAALLIACQAEAPGRPPVEPGTGTTAQRTGTAASNPGDSATAAHAANASDPTDAASADAMGTNAADATGATDPMGVPGEHRAAVLFLGTSLTAGYGVGADAAFPALIQARIDAAGLPFRVVNAGLSGETSAGGLSRLAWSLQDSIAVLVLELGANDGLRGLPVEQMHDNLDAILGRTRERYPDVEIVITGMEAPPNMGGRYTRAFRSTFADLAREYDAALVPFLLEGVAAEPSLNQSDGIHPNRAGHRILADNVWAVLEPMLERMMANI
ncbi:MAG: arylesterase [Longimicrobiales bacterium]